MRHIAVALSCYLKPVCASHYSLYLPVVSEAAYEPRNYRRSLLDWCSILIMFLLLESLTVPHVTFFSTSPGIEVVLQF